MKLSKCLETFTLAAMLGAFSGRSRCIDGDQGKMKYLLENENPPIFRSAATFQRVAFVSLIWPAIVAVLLYGEWLLATWSLGHVPRPSMDDPADVAGSGWMHIFTMLAVLGAVPAAVTALVLNTIAVELHKPTVLRGLFRLVAVMMSWAVLVVLVRWDPGAVLLWWID